MHTLSPIDFLKTAHSTAQHFGFTHIDALKSPLVRTQPRAQKASVASRKLDNLGGALTSGVSTYFERSLHGEQPSFFFTTYAMPRTGELALSLQIVGVKKSIAESILIQTLRSLACDLGFLHHCVRINSLGDSDSSARYSRELTTFFKKRLEDMPVAARELMKENAIATLLHLLEQKHELAAKSPSPLEYLSDPSRRHFRDIIEYLDMTETPYEIDTRLIGHHQCYSDALFSLELRDEEREPLADAPLTIRGGRIDAYSKNILGSDVPAAGAVVILHNKRAPARLPRLKSVATPSVFMVQLGFGPKIRSLMLLDTLKASNINVHQALASDSLSEQLRQAESHNVPYSIILGQKEYVENSVIIRDMRSRSQQHIPFSTLIPHLKRITKSV